MNWLKRLFGPAKLDKELISPAEKLGKELNAAAEKGDLAEVKRLIAAGADKDAKANGGATPLLIAASKGHTEVVQCLLAAGADKEAKEGYSGMTALHFAAAKGHTGVVQCLLAAGANKEATTNSCDRFKTARQMAYNEGHMAVFELLINNGEKGK